MTSRGSEVNTLLYSTRLYKGSPSRGSEEERMRIPLLVSLYILGSLVRYRMSREAKGSEEERKGSEHREARQI